ncbi:MAG: DUF2157 domain-containing protein [Vicinamibacterales bacterium]
MQPGDRPWTREQAQARVDRIRAFRDELAELESAGVLRLRDEERNHLAAHHDELLRLLAARFDVDRSEAEKQMSLGMRIASFLGALAFSIACFLFFYRFWGLMSVPLQGAILSAAPLLAVAGVEVAARREKTLYVASILSLVAFACFVLDISVLGSIFNMAPSAFSLLPWGLFALALAYGYRLRLLLLIGIAVSGGFVAAILADAAGLDWTAFALRPEGIVAAGLLALAAAAWEERHDRPAFAQVYRLTGWVAVLLPMLFLCQEAGFSYLPFGATAVERLYDVAAVVAGAAALWTGIARRRLGVVNTATLFASLFLFLKLYDWLWDWMPRYLFFFLVGLLALGVLALLQRLRRRLGM